MTNQSTQSTEAAASVDITALSNKELLSLIKSKDEEKEKLTKELEKATGVNQELQSELELKAEQASRVKEVFVTHNKKKYVFVSNKFTRPNLDSPEEPSIMTAAEVAKDKELVKNLIESKSGLLVEIKES